MRRECTGLCLLWPKSACAVSRRQADTEHAGVTSGCHAVSDIGRLCCKARCGVPTTPPRLTVSSSLVCTPAPPLRAALAAFSVAMSSEMDWNLLPVLPSTCAGTSAQPGPRHTHMQCSEQ